jgi:hypothetical protein
MLYSPFPDCLIFPCGGATRVLHICARNQLPSSTSVAVGVPASTPIGLPRTASQILSQTISLGITVADWK